jgi:hypothetical protein
VVMSHLPCDFSQQSSVAGSSLFQESRLTEIGAEQLVVGSGASVWQNAPSPRESPDRSGSRGSPPAAFTTAGNGRPAASGYALSKLIRSLAGTGLAADRNPRRKSSFREG